MSKPFIIPFGSFMSYTPTLPALYWDVDSQEERIKKICKELHRLVEYAKVIGTDINLTHDAVDELAAEFEKFKESGFYDFYEKQIEEWIKNNLLKVMSALLGVVWFGLTDDGYFTAEIGNALFMTFDTDMVYSHDEYGHLEIIY